MAVFTCPHCGQLLKVIPQRTAGHSRSTFESTAPTIQTARTGIIGASLDLLHFLRGGKAEFNPQAKEVKTLRIEQISEDGRHWMLHDLDQRIEFKDLVICGKAVAAGENFSRPATEKRGLSQGKFHIIKDEFLRLNLCYRQANNHFLTLRGAALLRKVVYEAGKNGT